MHRAASTRLLALLLAAGAHAACSTAPYRPIDGTGSSCAAADSLRGAAGQPLITTLTPRPAFDPDETPSARLVSNVLYSSIAPPLSEHDVNSVFLYFGQFLAHDAIFTLRNGSASTYIEVPRCDAVLDPSCSGTALLELPRNVEVNRLPRNDVTGFLDGSTVYGETLERANELRSFSGGKLTMADNGLPPLRADGHFDLGDPRGTVTPALSTLIILFVREHNRRCDELAARDPTLSDEELYQEARSWVGAVIQRITYVEYLPRLLGAPLPDYTGHDPTVDPSIDFFFATASFRYGHSGINSLLPRLDGNGDPHPSGHALLRDVFFSSGPILDSGIEPFLRGLYTLPESAVDTIMVRDLRDFGPEAPDLAATNILRGREHRLPKYNDARVHYGLPRITSFRQAAGGDDDLADRLALLYDSVDDIDPWVGTLLEEPVHGGIVGALSHASLTDQFERLRAGDRFFYQNTDVYSAEFIAEVADRSFADVIRDVAIDFGMEPPASTFAVYSFASGGSDGGGAAAAGTSGTVELMSGYTLSWDKGDSEIAFEMVGQTTGWVGIGFGASSMSNADIVLGWVSADGTVTVQDMFSTGNNPAPDTSFADGTDDLVAGSVSGSQVDGVTTIRFARPLVSADASRDRDIAGVTQIIFARGPSDSLEYHGVSSRATGSIDFDAAGGGSVSVTRSSTAKFLQMHGFFMFLSFAVMYPLGIFIVRYSASTPSILNLHQNVMAAAALMGVLVSVVAALSIRRHAASTHAQMGIVVMAILLAQFSLGLLAKTDIVTLSVRRVGQIRFVHIYLGRIVLVLGLVNIFLGIDWLFPGDMALVGAYGAWLAVVVVAFYLLGERNWIRYFLRSSGGNYIEALAGRRGQKVARPGLQPTKDAQLPVFTKAEFKSRVAQGEKWVLLEPFILDLRPFVSQHPGGERLLKGSIGQSIALDLRGEDGGHKHSRFALWKTKQLIMGRLSDGEYDQAEAQENMELLQQKNNVMSMPRLAPTSQDQASSYPTYSLESGTRGGGGGAGGDGAVSSAVSMSTPHKGILDILENGSGDSHKVVSSAGHKESPRESEPKETASIPSHPESRAESFNPGPTTEADSSAGRSDFDIIKESRRRKLVALTIREKTLLCEGRRPVYLVRLGPLDKDNVPQPSEHGQDYNLVFVINGRRVARPYTPVSNVDGNGMIDFVIRVYPEGKATQHLLSQQPGDMIGISEPINERLDFPPKSDGAALEDDFTLALGEELPVRNFICLVGGTGLCAVYRTIKVLLEETSTEHTNKITLVYANHTEEDVFFKDRLDGLAALHGNLAVTYLVTEYTAAGEIPSNFVVGRISDKGFLGNTLPAPPSLDETHKCLVAISGPLEMVNDTGDRVEELGFPKRCIQRLS